MLSYDYEDLFKILNAYKIKYLVVGAHAVIFYSEPRFTKDLDVWIPMTLNESARVYEALKAFGAPLRNISAESFQDPKMIFQIGVAPVRIDILSDLAGIQAKEAWKNRKRSKYGKTQINIIGPAELIKAKKIAGRPQDKLDLARLQARLKGKL